MAVYIPASTWERARETVRIIRSEEQENFTSYIIEFSVPPTKWTLSRRYKQFAELHEKMTKQFAVNKSLLPPKKLLGNRSEKFILQRQKELEIYLQTLVYMFSQLPEPLALFLELPKYEIRYITAALSEMLFTEGDSIIRNGKPFTFTALQLNAISERLKLGEATCYSNNPKQDLAHLVEFVNKLKHLLIVGSNQPHEACNFRPNGLTYELSMFKSLEILELSNCRCDTKLSSVGHLRPLLKSLTIKKTLDALSEFFLCDTLHWSPTTDVQSWPTWNYVTHADFSDNKLSKIDASIKLLPNVQHLDLSHNFIHKIENLESLSDLSVLILSHNRISQLDSLHTYLGNIHVLNLSSNFIQSLHGLSKLFSVSELILENNRISSMSELKHLSQLPCLEVLNLLNNPVTFTVDYRPQLLLILNSIASEIILDGQKATEKEIDTVSVLQALQLARRETYSKIKPNSEDTRTRILENDMPVNDFPFQSASSLLKQENNSLIGNTNENVQFRHQVESLRKVGGSDWLRLLNEMHCSASKNEDEQVVKDCDKGEGTSSDTTFPSVCSSESYSEKLSPQVCNAITFSNEISYPEWLINHFDSDNEEFKTDLLCKRENDPIDLEHSTQIELLHARVLWVVLVKTTECSRSEIPVCMLVLNTGFMLFQLKKCENREEFPDFQHLRTIFVANVVSIFLGPCSAYIEFEVRSGNGTELLTMLLNQVSANMSVSEVQTLYRFNLLQKYNPFLNSTLNLENIDFDVPKSMISRQFIFGQRVCVSKVLHKCEHDVLHYIFITSSHLLLVEEKLHNPKPAEKLLSKLISTTVKPQFKVCTLISVHTNIKQIHLKDIDCDKDYDSTDVEFYNKEIQSLLYASGCWLILEFEPNTVLCVNFYNCKQRNEFLNAFLGARKQR
ncbi:hypothetical protein JTE90_022966 [Oedothorax gibbosus]|uniref:Nischarin n=1 Tax=Oedothorax gibbosus TaxID=931172 RepID=A0AAV6VCE7_9ARAC|nr:hypothetical protein JTE90_022966 [Oedothorax gibbosus]